MSQQTNPRITTTVKVLDDIIHVTISRDYGPLESATTRFQLEAPVATELVHEISRALMAMRFGRAS